MSTIYSSWIVCVAIASSPLPSKGVALLCGGTYLPKSHWMSRLQSTKLDQAATQYKKLLKALILMRVTSCSYSGSFPESLLSMPPSYCQSFRMYHPAAYSIIYNISIRKFNVERNLVTPCTFSIGRAKPAALSARVAQLQILRAIHYLFGTPVCSRCHVDGVSWIVDGHVQRAMLISGI